MFILLFTGMLTSALNIQPVKTELAPVAVQSEEPPVAEWNYSYGGGKDEFAFSVDETSDGGYVMAGATHSYGIGFGADAWLVKTYSNGTKQWEQYYGGTGHDYANSVQQTHDDGYIMAGVTDSFSSDGTQDIWLIKTDATGGVQWTRTIGTVSTDNAHSVQQTSDGGYIIAGSYLPDPDSIFRKIFWLVKTNASGYMEWNTPWGGGGTDIAFSAQQTWDAGFIAAGSTDSYGSTDGILIKTDAWGRIEWNQTYGQSNSLEQIYSVQPTYDGGYIAAGYSNSSTLDDDFWLIKISSGGSMVWSRFFGGLDDDWCSSVQQTSDGGYVLAGSTYSSGDSSPDYLVVKTDINGNEEWRQVYGTDDTDQAQSIHETKDGGYVVAGYSYHFHNGVGTDGWLVKIVGDTDKDGLPDTWERKGIDYNRDGVTDLNLSDLGADWRHKDLFVEVDYMGSNGTHDHKPDSEAINAVKTAFKNSPVKNPDNKEGINLHIDIDEEIPHQNVIKAWDDFDSIRNNHFGNQTQRSDANSANILGAKKLVCRYCLFVHEFSWNKAGTWVATASSGYAELPGNDFIVSLGGWEEDRGSTDEQAGTFMHELGHTLGLRHGGADGVNFKPNYLSVMNYAFMLPVRNPYRPLDYSRVQLPDLDEARLNENAGIGAEVTGQMLFTVYSNAANATVLSAGFLPIDWNGNGNASDVNVQANINNFPEWGWESPANETLTGYNDWGNLVYNFRHLKNFEDNAHGEEPRDDLTWQTVQLMREAVESMHDIAVLKIDTPKPMIPTGSSLNLSVTLMNQGNYSEASSVTVYANATPIASQELTIERWNTRTINLTGETSGFSDGNYTLSAYVTPVANEDDVGDNTYNYGLLKIASGWVDWSKSYYGTEGKARSVCQTTDGGFAVAGKAGYYEEFLLIKTYPNGSDQWTKSYAYGAFSKEGAHSVRQTNDGGYILAGYTTYTTSPSVVKPASLMLVKTDPEGNIVWSKTHGGDDFNDMYEPVWVAIQTNDGGYVAAGSRRAYPGATYDMWLIKTDSQGNALWNKTYGGFTWEYAYSVWQTSDGGYAVGGYTYGGGSEGEDEPQSGAWLVKTDSAGTQQWNRTYANACAYSIQQTADGGYILAGAMYFYGTNPGSDFWLQKTDADGSPQWTKTYGSTLWAGMPGGSYEEAYCVQPTAEGGYILAGMAQAYGTDLAKAWIVKTDGFGNKQNELAFGENDESRYVAYSIQQTSDGSYIAAGSAGTDFLLFRFSLLTIIPEFPTWMILPSLMIMMLTAVVLQRKRRQT